MTRCNHGGSRLVEIVAATVVFLLLIAAVTIGMPIIGEALR